MGVLALDLDGMKRRAPWMPVTMPIVSPLASSSGPCSICASRKAATGKPSGRAGTSGSAARVACSASSTVIPASSLTLRMSASDFSPTKPPEPIVPIGKRAPPSSQVHTTASSGRRVAMPARSIASSASQAASTP